MVVSSGWWRGLLRSLFCAYSFDCVFSSDFGFEMGFFWNMLVEWKHGLGISVKCVRDFFSVKSKFGLKCKRKLA